MGFREVHAQAAPRGGEEGRLPVRGVFQENHCLTECQITSAQAVYWLSPGCRPSEAIQPGVPRPERLAAVMSIHPKPPLSASSRAVSLEGSGRARIRPRAPYSPAAGPTHPLG